LRQKRKTLKREGGGGGDPKHAILKKKKKKNTSQKEGRQRLSKGKNQEGNLQGREEGVCPEEGGKKKQGRQKRSVRDTNIKKKKRSKIKTSKIRGGEKPTKVRKKERGAGFLGKGRLQPRKSGHLKEEGRTINLLRGKTNSKKRFRGGGKTSLRWNVPACLKKKKKSWVEKGGASAKKGKVVQRITRDNDRKGKSL